MLGAAFAIHLGKRAARRVTRGAARSAVANRRRGIVSILISSLVLAAVPLPLPLPSTASATSVDLVQTPPTGWSAEFGCSTACANLTNAFDADDGTYSDHSADGGDGCGASENFTNADCYWTVRFIRASGVTTFSVGSARLKWGETGIAPQPITQIEFRSGPQNAEVGSCYDTGVNGMSATTGDQVFTCNTPVEISDSDYFTVHFHSQRIGGYHIALYSFEIYQSAPLDFGSDKPLGWTFGHAYSPDPVNLATGNFVHHAEDLSLPGRLLGAAFTRWYNSADPSIGSLGPAWTHSYNWTITDSGATVSLRRGDGSVNVFTRNPDGSYADPPGVFDSLVKNPDATYALTLTNQVSFAFSSSGVLTRIAEPAGNHIDLAYTAGKLTTITDTVGRGITLSYDGANRLTQLQDPIGRKVTYAYDSNGRLATITDKIGNAAGQNPLLHQWHYGYDGTTQHLTTITDPDGRVIVTNTYDSQGRVYQQRDGLSAVTTFAYTNLQTVLTDPRSHATTYTFDSLYRELSESDVVGANTFTLSYTYDAAGNRDSVTDRNGNRTDFTFDSRANPLTRTDPLVNQQTPRYLTQYQYDAKNNLTQITDARNFITTNSYDPTTNVKLSTSQQTNTQVPPTYAVTKWEYADAANPGLPTKVISPRGNTGPNPNYSYAQSLSYDTQGNLVQRIDADGNKQTFGYDGVSRQITLVDPDGYAVGGVPSEHTWTTTYDENDRVTQEADPFAHAILTGYDGAGNRTSITDRNGNVTIYTYDGAARLATVKQKPDPVGNPTLVYTTTVVRDGNGNATQITQGNQVVTDYGYDALNRPTSFTTHPSGTQSLTTSYVLDGDGNSTQRTSGDGVQTSYQYDALSRLTQVSATGLTTITYAYDELSQRTAMTDGTGNSTYSYDGLGRMTQAIQPNGTLGYGYDLDSNRTTLTYPTVGSVSYVFSPAGRLSSLTDWGSRQSSYTYTASGLAKTVAVAGGMTTTYGYDRAQRPTSLVNATGAQTITSDTYTLDNEGNRTTIDEQMNGIFASAKVNSDTGTAVQDHPAVALGNETPNPASYLIWDDQRDGATNSNIYFSRRDPVTGVWSANVKVNTDTTTRNQANPAIAVDGASNAFAVWDDFRDATNNQNIYYSKRSAATGTWSTPNLKVNDGTGNTNERNPRIAGTAAGAETAVWVDLRSSQNNIYASTLAAGGSTWAANKKVTDNTAAVKDFPDVAVSADGTSYAVWQDSRNGNADIYFSTLTSGGSAWAANVKISDDPGTTAQTRARIGLDSAGNLIAAWIDARTTPARVRAARKPAGGSWSASIEISPSPANAQSLALSVRADGYAWAVWGDTRGTSQDVWGSRYDPYLATWSTPLRLDDDPGTTAAQSNPTVAFSASEIMLGWRDNRLNVNGNTQARRAVFVPGLTDHFALTYDGLNRLKSVTGPVAESFAFDGASNITSRTGPSQTDIYDNSNRITSDGTTSYSWSNADRLTNRGADTFGYDPLDRLTSSTVAGTSRTYAYNGDGLLQAVTQGSTSNYLWDSRASAAALLQQGSDRVVYGLGPLYVVHADGTTLSYARDGLGSVRAERTDSSGALRAFRYSAYGLVAQSTGGVPTTLAFAGELLDGSALVYLRARWYDPTSQRFITRDPYPGVMNEPASLNAFMYVGGNPAMSTDPTGRCPWCIVVGAGIGGFSSLAGYAVAASVTGQPVRLDQAAIAFGTGAVTGGLCGAMLFYTCLATSGAASVVQYHLSPGEKSPVGYAAAAITGVAAGKFTYGAILPHYNWAPNLIADVQGAIIGEALYRGAGNFVRSAFASVLGSLAQSSFASANTNMGMSGNK